MKKFKLKTLTAFMGLIALCSCGGSENGGKPVANVEVHLPVEKRLEFAKKYEYMAPFFDGLARVCLNGKSGFIDKSGKEVIPCVYNDAGDFFDGLARVCIGDWETGKCGFIDKTGKEVIPCEYDGVSVFSDGVAGVALNEKRGIIDKTGKYILPCVYDDIKYVGVDIFVGSVNGGIKYYYDRNGDFLGN